MIAGNNHIRTENYLLEAGSLYRCDYIFESRGFRNSINGSHECVCVSVVIIDFLNFFIQYFRIMMGSMTHIYEGGFLVRFCFFYGHACFFCSVFIQCFGHSFRICIV